MKSLTRLKPLRRVRFNFDWASSSFHVEWEREVKKLVQDGEVAVLIAPVEFEIYDKKKFEEAYNKKKPMLIKKALKAERKRLGLKD